MSARSRTSSRQGSRQGSRRGSRQGSRKLRKIPNQRRYQLTPKGRQLTISLQALLGVSIEALMKQIA